MFCRIRDIRSRLNELQRTGRFGNNPRSYGVLPTLALSVGLMAFPSNVGDASGSGDSWTFVSGRTSPNPTSSSSPSSTSPSTTALSSSSATTTTPTPTSSSSSSSTPTSCDCAASAALDENLDFLSLEEIEKRRAAVTKELEDRAAREGIIYGWSPRRLSQPAPQSGIIDSILTAEADREGLASTRRSVLQPLFSALRHVGAFCRASWRILALSVRFLPILLSYPLVSYFDVPNLRALWCTWLRSSLAAAGPCFVKLGQWIATRPDAFPADICAALSVLHTAASTHDWAHTERVIGDSLAAHGVGIDDLFVELGRAPIASGAIAQVYKATLHDGRQVALKVRHPGIERSIALDLSILNGCARLANNIAILKSLSLPVAAAEFSRIMVNQVDLRLEALNLLKFRHHFASFRGIIDFPQPLAPLSDALLIETFCEGVPIQTYMGAEGRGTPAFKKQVAYLGMSCFLKMLIVDNFIHADMHPGNILVSTKPTARRRKLFSRFRSQHQLAQPRSVHHGDQQRLFSMDDRSLDAGADFGARVLHDDEVTLFTDEAEDENIPSMYILDVGLVTELSAFDRESFLGLFGAVVSGDGKAGARMMLERSPRVEPLSKEDTDAFIGEIDQLLSVTIQRPLNEIPIADTFSRLLTIAQKYEVRLEANFVSLMTGIITIEGLARQLDADFNLLEEAKPLLVQSKDIIQVYLKNNLTRVAQRARSKFQDLSKKSSIHVP